VLSIVFRLKLLPQAVHGLLFARSPRNDAAYRAFDQVMQSDCPLPGTVYHELVFTGTGIELHGRAYIKALLKLIVGRLENG
jgi:hypothetical protein